MGKGFLHLRMAVRAFNKDTELSLDKKQLKSIVVQALLSLHGQSGAAILVDIIRCTWHPNLVEAVLRLPRRDLVKVWSALTLMGSYGDRQCSVQVHQVSGSLMGLAVSSREDLT